jgi:quercetin dioxygenase-like cupin family protein
MNSAIAHPMRLTDLVDYQPGAVVSRVLLRTAAGVVTVFAFAEGEGLTEHSTPHDATLQMLEGTLALTVGGTEHEVRAGEIIHLPAAVPHALRGGGRFKMLLTLLKKPATD